MNKISKILGVLCLLFLSAYIFFKLFCIYRQSRLRILALKTIEKFNEHNVQYWVDYGTLLGIVREGDIIPYDTDVDICLIQTPDLHKKLKQIVNELKDYVLEYHDWGAYRIRENPFVYADLYLINEVDGMYVDPTGKIPIELVGKTRLIPWKYIQVRVPEKTHESLVWRYGKNYMTPKMWKKNENFEYDK